METPEVRSTLIQSSPNTRAWLKTLRDELQGFEYTEAKFYASFRSKVTCRSFAKLNPQKKGIRLFVRLKASEDPDLKSTPSTKNWAAFFPSSFKISSEQDLIKAKVLIERSEVEDRSRH
jgi:hypothetical protein